MACFVYALSCSYDIVFTFFCYCLHNVFYFKYRHSLTCHYYAVMNCVGTKNPQHYSISFAGKKNPTNTHTTTPPPNLENHFFDLFFIYIYVSVYIYKTHICISKSFACSLHVSLGDCWVKNICKCVNATKNI